jgi:hypothetical protein
MANMTTSLPLRGTIRRVSDREVATRADDELNRGRNPLYVREGSRPLIRQVRTYPRNCYTPGVVSIISLQYRVVRQQAVRSYAQRSSPSRSRVLTTGEPTTLTTLQLVYGTKRSTGYMGSGKRSTTQESTTFARSSPRSHESSARFMLTVPRRLDTTSTKRSRPLAPIARTA